MGLPLMRMEHAPQTSSMQLASQTTGSTRLPAVFTGFSRIRISTEMISALLVGVGMGWMLDRAFDTKPVMMVICIFLGGAAGLLNVYKTAMRMAENIDTDSQKSDTQDATNEDKPTPEGGKTLKK